MPTAKTSEKSTRKKTAKKTTAKKSTAAKKPRTSRKAKEIESAAAPAEPETVETPGIEQTPVSDYAPEIIPELPLTPDAKIEDISKGISSIFPETDNTGYEQDLISEVAEYHPVEFDGGYNISKKVLARIASLAASEIDGLLPPRSDAINKLIDSIHGRTDGIRVAVGTTDAAIDMLIRVQFGTHIPDATGRLRETIVKRIHEMTGLSVARVDIRVQDVIQIDEAGIELSSKEPPTASA